ncbi:hypothetical protein, conserved, partial [Babesia bigemina]
TRVHSSKLGPSILEQFDDPDEEETESDVSFKVIDVAAESISLPAHPNNVIYNKVADALNDICAKSYDVLTRILGTGDAFTTYAVDYSNNSLKLYYPESGEDCLNMVLDILRRLFPALQFLYTQCHLSTKHGGWYDCQYGRDVGSTKWPCNEHTKASTKASTKEPTKESTKCSTNSPLQSYLSDCLTGCLPHDLSSIGCRSVCSTCAKSKPGMPCLTPLGFRGFSGSTRTGRDICEILRKFFSNAHLSALICLVPKPPSTLPEHFSYALSLVEGLKDSVSHPLRDAVDSAITKQSIDLYRTYTELTGALRDAYGSTQESHSEDSHSIKTANLASLSKNTRCDNKLCAPYLRSLFNYSYRHLPKKHKDLYLSWAIYLPWSFHKFLKLLLEEFKQIYCRDWGCRSCQHGNSCRPGHHGSFDTPCHCSSIVSCKGVMATLYRCGFVFGDAAMLNEDEKSKTCAHFGVLLSRVISSDYFKQLFKTCDNFLWKIREPFIWLNVALWLLSLLYLLHIMVIRLDLLHIKSHLHSPSSHRIAAQSLLAAARVNKLNKVFYLQP